MKILGIDEAGRGCVIGPLVVAGVIIEEGRLRELVRQGISDSKKLSSERRAEFFSLITSQASFWAARQIPPVTIDENNLNLLESREIVSLIVEASPEEAIFDVPTHPAGVSNFVKSIRAYLSVEVSLRGENRADEKFPLVSAASIIAKVTRDQLIEELKERYGDFGCGYAHDPKTRAFLRRYFEKQGKFPPIVRRKWLSAQRFLIRQQTLL